MSETRELQPPCEVCGKPVRWGEVRVNWHTRGRIAHSGCYDLAAALASKDAEIEQLRAILSYLDTFAPHMFPTEREMGFDVDKVVNPPWAPNQAAGATPQPRSEASGSELPGNRWL